MLEKPFSSLVFPKHRWRLDGMQPCLRCNWGAHINYCVLMSDLWYIYTMMTWMVAYMSYITTETEFRMTWRDATQGQKFSVLYGRKCSNCASSLIINIQAFTFVGNHNFANSLLLSTSMVSTGILSVPDAFTHPLHWTSMLDIPRVQEFVWQQSASCLW